MRPTVRGGGAFRHFSSPCRLQANAQSWLGESCPHYPRSPISTWGCDRRRSLSRWLAGSAVTCFIRSAPVTERRHAMVDSLPIGWTFSRHSTARRANSARSSWGMAINSGQRRESRCCASFALLSPRYLPTPTATIPTSTTPARTTRVRLPSIPLIASSLGDQHRCQGWAPAASAKGFLLFSPGGSKSVPS